jgi:hypothetical protein
MGWRKTGYSVFLNLSKTIDTQHFCFATDAQIFARLPHSLFEENKQFIDLTEKEATGKGNYVLKSGNF